MIAVICKRVERDTASGGSEIGGSGRMRPTHGDLTRKNCFGKLVTGVVNWKIDPLPMIFE